VHEVKTGGMQVPLPSADGVPEQVLQSHRWFASTELLTSDAVFEPMQDRWLLAVISVAHHLWRLTVGLNLNDKKAVVAEISAQVAKAQTIVVAEYRGIQVGHLTQLRAKARAQGVYLRVLKNTLARRAVEGTTFANLASEMTGPLIYSISEDAVAAAKVINDFAKTNDKLVVKAGNYAGKSLDKAAVAALASIPSREVLLSQLLGVMLAPVSGFARGLAALAAKKEAEAA
jgi:large subunit ribosomal protein L10